MHQIFAGFERIEMVRSEYRGGSVSAVGEVPPRVMCDRFQPGTKTVVGIVTEILHSLGQLEQYRLRDVLSILRLQSPAQAPGVNLATVVIDEVCPCHLIRLA